MSTQSLPVDDLRDLYRELILEHARSPRHFGKLNSVSHQAEGINPLCGDKLRLYLNIDAEQTISAVNFEGSGCAISVASASLLTETINGLNTERALDYYANIVALLTGVDAANSETRLDLGRLKALEGVREFPSRVKCATLAWHALHAAINNKTDTVSTE